ncbi:DUF4253 domain-containing protein [Catenuloplanes sp. NPDC051500]|uniref:DUF4253 domain-containing protein n=1 Tax=Catenuloplanes sp. NPDC051500 TaxID=3363959 RepID=UPI00379B5AF4
MLDSLSVPLPPGKLVTGEGDDKPAMWVSDGPAPAGLWPTLRAAHATSGLWPLLLDALGDDDGSTRPWDDGEFSPSDASDPAAFDPAALLATGWDDNTSPDGDSDDLAPYGSGWPGLAPAIRFGDPARTADDAATEWLRMRPARRLGLIPAGRPADAVTTIGWTGAINYVADSAQLSAVLRSWEDRFGAVLIGAGFAELHLSVPTPPTSAAAARPLAAEHFAFCPDQVYQGAGSLKTYAGQLVNAPIWSFWWD